MSIRHDSRNERRDIRGEVQGLARPAFDTIAIHGGAFDDPLSGSVNVPVYQTVTYGQDEVGGTPAYCYSRTGNPTRTALERQLATLEGAEHGLAFASGMAAINNVLNVLKSGDHVVAGQDLYGGAYRIFTKLYAKFGVTFTFVDTTDPANVAGAITRRTRLLWLESPSNPLLRLTDIEACAGIARRAGVVSVVDNTFATPVLQRPLDLGADVVVHSTTKSLAGHSDVLGGAILTRDAELHEPFRFFQNAVGAVPGPQDCFLVLRGLRTVGLRVERHCLNARRVAEFLAEHPAVKRVYYPGLASHPQYALARRQQRDFGGVVSFELGDDVEAVKRFASGCRLWTLAESLGGVKSLWCHPPTMTHASVEPEVRRGNGIRDGLIRLSVGIEDAEDLIADLAAALECAASARGSRARKTPPEPPPRVCRDGARLEDACAARETAI
ncbi:MAG: Cystathionine beta-lyase [Phycisphaerae bacterium]|nr:Cystathionine beta-lyase [Phycisphaerae bacterium]